MKYSISFIFFHISFIVLHNMQLLYTVLLLNKTKNKNLDCQSSTWGNQIFMLAFSSSITWYISIISPFIFFPSLFHLAEVEITCGVMAGLFFSLFFSPEREKKRFKEATFVLKHAFLYLYMVCVHALTKFLHFHLSRLLLSTPCVLPFYFLLVFFTSVLYFSGISMHP